MAEPRTTESHTTEPPRGGRVVVVGDTEFFLVPVSQVVDRAGLEAHVFGDAAGALSAMRGWPEAPAAVIVNLTSLGLDGVRALERLADDLPDTPRPLLACVDNLFDRADSGWLKGLGVDLVIDKRSSPVALAAELRTLVFGAEAEVEHRKDPRVATCFPVEYRHGDRTASGYCVSLSLGGMFVRTRHPVPLAEQTALRFDLEERELELTARVVYTSGPEQPAEGTGPKGPPGMGLRFTELDGEARRAIDAHLGEALGARRSTRRSGRRG